MPFDGGTRAQQRLWTPKDISSGLCYWYDAADLNTIILNGANVSQWSDKSGFTNHLVQPTAANQPPFINGAGNTKAVNFTGTAQQLATAANAVVPLAAAKRVFVSLIKPNETTTSTHVIGYGTTASNGKFILVNFSSHYPFIGDGLNNIDPVITPATSPILVCYGYDGALFVNTNGAPFFRGGAVPEATQASPLYVGFQPVLSRNALLSNHYEHIGFTGMLDYNVVARLEGYLMHKWGFQGSLPAGHPYKLQPPRVTY